MAFLIAYGEGGSIRVLLLLLLLLLLLPPLLLSLTTFPPLFSFPPLVVIYHLGGVGVGTVLSMGLATSVIGEGTCRVVVVAGGGGEGGGGGGGGGRPLMSPRSISIGSSYVAILIGLCWSYKAFI